MTATVTPVLSLYSGFWGQIPTLAMNVDKGTLVYNQSQKHPYKLEFVYFLCLVTDRQIQPLIEQIRKQIPIHMQGNGYPDVFAFNK